MTTTSYRRLSPLTPVVRGFILVVAAGWTILRDITRGDLGPTALALVGLLVIGGMVGVASWLRTKFWIEADELRIDTGVVSRQSRRIRIDRLQGVEIVQPFVARLFGLAEIRMDVAGGGAREGSLAFLPLADARELKDVLLARRDAVRARAAGGPTDAAPLPVGVISPEALWGTPQPAQPPVPERVLARVDMGMLMLSILLSLETVFALVALFGLLAAFSFSGQWLGASATVPILLGIGVVQFRKFAGNYNFTVSQTSAGLQVRRGLFDLNSQTIALHRLQGVVVTEPLLWRSFGWARLDVSIAGYSSGGDDEGPAPSTVLPVGDRRLVAYLAQYVLGGIDVEQTPMTPPPRTSRWVAPVGHRFMAAGRDEQLVVSREGWLVRRTHAAPHARLQSLRITQGPFQRVLGLADLHMDSPPGPTYVRARHRNQAEARAFFEEEVVVSRSARGRS